MNSGFTAPPDRKILRRMSYLSDQQGIINRYLREQDGWRDHLEKTKNFITKCLTTKKIDQLVVLGSGWLLDFPFEELADNIRSIILVDIYHPPQILHKVRNFHHIDCVTADITGGYIKAIYDEVKRIKKGKFPAVIRMELSPPVLGKDRHSFILSLNLLNQLDILLVDYIKKQVVISEENIREIRRKLQSDHLSLITGQQYILITDYEEITRDFRGEAEMTQKLIYTDLPAGEYSEEWTWHFDTQGEYHPGRKTLLKVRAISSESPEMQ